MAIQAKKSTKQATNLTALRKSERWLRALLEHSYDAIVSTSADGKTIYASPSIQRVLGYTPEEYMSCNGAELTHPDDLENGITFFRRIREQPGVTFPPHRTRFRHKDGSWRWIEYTATNLLTDSTIGALVFNFRDITERKHAEETQHLLAAIVASSDDVIVSKTLNGIITSWNAAAEKLFGYTAQEAVGQHISLIIPPELHQEEEVIIQHLRNGQRIDHYETVRLRKDGTTVAVSLSISPVKDKEGKTIGAAKIARDITERKRAEEQQTFLNEVGTILASSLDYQTTLSTLARLAVPRLADWCSIDLEHDGSIEQVAVFHPDQEIIAWSKQVQQLHQPAINATVGVPKVIHTGKTLFCPLVTDAMLMGAAKSEEELALMRNIGVSSCIIVPLRLQGKTFGTMTFSFTHVNRHYTRADVAFAEAVASRAALAIENAQLYQQAKEAREQLEVILQNVADGIIVYDQHHQIIYANEAAAHLTGFSSVQTMLVTLPNGIVAQFELIDEQGHPFPLSQLPHQRVLAGEQEAQAMIGYRKSSTPQSIHWSISKARPVLDEQGKLLFAITIIHDITERVQAEQRKDAFISIASHELKTPVTSLKGFAHVLERRLRAQGDEQGLVYLAKMDRQLNKLTKLISELLDISRMQVDKLILQQEAFDLSSLVQEIVENLQLTTRTHQLCFEDTEPVLVVGDRERIGQVLINLVTNAIKYSPQADKVIIRIARDQSHALLSVQDFGIGIAKEHHQHIFERFYQVTDPGGQTYPGLGIGLYIASDIISRHGGHIWLESTEGKGSTFSISLPLSEEAKETSSSDKENGRV